MSFLLLSVVIACMDLGTDINNKLADRQNSVPRTPEEQTIKNRKDKAKVRLAVSAHLCADQAGLKEATEARAKPPKWPKPIPQQYELEMTLHDADSRIADAKSALRYAKQDQQRRSVSPMNCNDPQVKNATSCFRAIHKDEPLPAECRQPDMIALFDLFEPN